MSRTDQSPVHAKIFVNAGKIKFVVLTERRAKTTDCCWKIEASADSLKPGETVKTPIAGTDLKGQPYQAHYRNDGRRHLLLFFSPTLLIDNTGKVEHAWVGKWDKSNIAEVAAAVDIRLDLSN